MRVSKQGGVTRIADTDDYRVRFEVILTPEERDRLGAGAVALGLIERNVQETADWAGQGFSSKPFRPMHLLGKRVRITVDDRPERRTVMEGVLLEFGDSGEFVLEDSDQFLHFGWPLLHIEEIPE